MTRGLCGAAVLALFLGTGCADEVGPARPAPPGAASECTRHGVCDDGIFCNGEERCESGRCAPGEPVDCDDGIACTTDQCDETAWDCRHDAPDADSDQHADAACKDSFGRPLGDDCDDADAARHPGAPEQCDPEEIDEDCDPSTVGAKDEDGDGAIASTCCNATSHDRQCGTDCDDRDPATAPGADEICDGRDNDCDGHIDEVVELVLFRDQDGDGHGTSEETIRSCTPVRGFAASDDDCDDGERSIHPGAPESCDTPAVDRDCNGKKNDLPGGCACKQGTERDCPEPGVCAEGVLTCANETWSACSIEPTPETCNGLDDDCDGRVDNDVMTECYEDEDGDDFAAAGAEALTLCATTDGEGCPEGYTTRAPAPGAIDCAPTDAEVSPASAELCNGRDDDCDGDADEGLPLKNRFLDADGDGHAGTRVERCSGDPDSDSEGDDCMDDNPLVYPGQEGVFSSPACGHGFVPCRLTDEDWRCKPAGSSDCVTDLDPARWDYDCDGEEQGQPFVSEPCVSADTCTSGCGTSGFMDPSPTAPSCGATLPYQVCRCLGAQGGGCAGSSEPHPYPCH